MSSLVGGPSMVGGLGPGPPGAPLNPALGRGNFEGKWGASHNPIGTNGDFVA